MLRSLIYGVDDEPDEGPKAILAALDGDDAAREEFLEGAVKASLWRLRWANTRKDPPRGVAWRSIFRTWERENGPIAQHVQMFYTRPNRERRQPFHSNLTQLHAWQLSQLLTMLLTAGDDAGVAAILPVLYAIRGHVEPYTIDASLWLLKRAYSDTGIFSPTDPSLSERARTIVQFLRKAKTPLFREQALASQVKARAPYIFALYRLAEFLSTEGYLPYAAELLQGELYMKPFADSSRLRAARCAVEVLSLLGQRQHDMQTDEDGHNDEDTTPVEQTRRSFRELCMDPSRFVATRAATVDGNGDPSVTHRVEWRELLSHTTAAIKLAASMDNMHHDQLVSLKAGMLSTTGKAMRAARLVHRHRLRNPSSVRAQLAAWQVLSRELGEDHRWSIAALKGWAELDPTSDTALDALVMAYRRQLLRSYRNPAEPVLIGRRRVVHAIATRLASLSASAPLNVRLRLARWLANYLGPLRPPRERLDLHFVDWDQHSVVQDVLAGRFVAWDPCFRGLEDLTLDLFDPWQHSLQPPPDARRTAFAYHFQKEGVDRLRWRPMNQRRDAVWTAIKNGGGVSCDAAEEKEDDVESSALDGAERRVNEGGNGGSDEEQDEDDEGALEKGRVGEPGDAEAVKVCSHGDDEDEELTMVLSVGGGGAGTINESKVRRLHQAALLAYKASAAAHMLGPDNRYTVLAVRKLWDSSRAYRPVNALRPGLEGLLAMLTDKFALDVYSCLRRSDRYLITTTNVQFKPRLTRPVALGLAEAACGRPLPEVPTSVCRQAMALGPPWQPRYHPYPAPSDTGRSVEELEAVLAAARAPSGDVAMVPDSENEVEKGGLRGKKRKKVAVRTQKQKDVMKRRARAPTQQHAASAEGNVGHVSDDDEDIPLPLLPLPLVPKARRTRKEIATS